MESRDPLAAAIAHHLKVAGELMAATRQAEGAPAFGNAEVIVRLDLILAKLDEPILPFEHRLWDSANWPTTFIATRKPRAA